MEEPMRSFFVKGSLVLALAAAFGMPNASAAPLVAVEPTVAVVDGNHAAIVGANGLLNAFIQNHPNAGITEIAFDADGGQIKYDVEGFDESGKYELTYIYATNQIFRSEIKADYFFNILRRNAEFVLGQAIIKHKLFSDTINNILLPWINVKLFFIKL